MSVIEWWCLQITCFCYGIFNGVHNSQGYSNNVGNDVCVETLIKRIKKFFLS